MKEKWSKARTLMHRGLSGFLSLMMVFSMLQPGLVQAADYTCGKEVHSHAEACYELKTEEKQTKTLACSATVASVYADIEGKTADFLVHTHVADCFAAEGQQICPLQEIAVHRHAEGCYAQENRCGLEEGEAHAHTKACSLTCEKDEVILHTHTEECYAPAEEGSEASPVLTCTTPVVMEHVHNDACYTQGTETVAVKTLTCTLEEHAHDDTCAAKPEETPSPEQTPSAYETFSQTLASLLEKAKGLSKDADDYEAQWEVMLEETEALRDTLASACEAGDISLDEYYALTDEVDEIENIYFADMVPEEEASAFVTDNTIRDSLTKQTNCDDIYIAVRKDGKLPGEPSLQNGSNYMFFDPDGTDAQGNPKYKQTRENDYCYSTNSGYIDPDIVKAAGFTKVGQNNDTSVAGLVDHTGVKTGAVLPGIDFVNLLEAIAATNAFKVNGVTINTSNMHKYKVICYVIKLQTSSCKGWHIDCTVVNKAAVTLSYNMNLPSGYTLPGLTGLDADSLVPSDHDNNSNTADVATFTVKHPIVNKNNIAVGATVTAKDSNGKDAEFKFLGWRTSPGGSGTLYTPNGKISVSQNTTLYAQWSTNLAIGALSVKKTVTAPSGTTAPNDFFTFTVKNLPAGTYPCKVYNANGTQASSQNISNNGTFVLKHNQYALIEGIAKNTIVTVQESVNGNYTSSWTSGTAQAKIVGGNTVELNCTNTYVPNTNITIKKEVTGTNKEFTFDVYVNGTKLQTVKMQGGQEKTVSVLRNAQVYIEETNSSDYATTYKINSEAAVSGKKTSTFAANGQTVTFTNTQYCSLSITKKVSGPAPTGAQFPINVKIGGADYANKTYIVNNAARTTDANGNISLAANETAVISGIPYGTAYAVSENPGSNYSVTYTGQNGTVGNNTSATVTNTRKTGSLTIKKAALVGTAIPDSAKKFNFTVSWCDDGVNYANQQTVDVTAGDAAGKTVSGIPYGAKVKIVETNNSDYNVKVNSTALTNGTYTFTYGTSGAETVTFTNTQTGKLSIQKTVAGGTIASDPEYVLCVTLKNGDATVPFASGAKYTVDGTAYDIGANGEIRLKAGKTAVIEQLPIGVTYTITEAAASAAGFTVAEASGTISTNSSATITNEAIPAEVTIPVSKILANTDGGEHAYSFKLTGTDMSNLKSGTSDTISVVPGTPGSFVLSYSTADLYPADSGKVAVSNDGTRTRTYVYTITEIAQAGSFAATAPKTVTVTLTGSKSSFTAVSDVTAENPASFENILLKDLVIEKVMAEGSVNVAKPYSVDVTVTSANFKPGMQITYPKLDAASGAGFAAQTITLANETSITLADVFVAPGTAATITGLPYDSTYTVVEDAAYGYAPSYAYSSAAEGAEGGVVTGSAPKATVTNTELTGALEIPVTKKLSNPVDGVAHGPYTFQLTQVLDAAGTALDNTVAHTDNDAELTISLEADAEEALGEFELSFLGSQLDREAEKTFFFKISENAAAAEEVNTDDAEYVVEVKVSHGAEALTAEIVKVHKTGDPNYTGTVAFTNTLLGALEITKVLDMVEEPSDSEQSDRLDKEFVFQIKLGGNVVADDTTYTVGEEVRTVSGGNGTITLKAGETARFEGLEAGISFEVTEVLESAAGYKPGYTVQVGSEDETEGKTGTIPSVEKASRVLVTVTNEELETELKLGGTKILTNPDKKEHTFQFALKQVANEKGEELAEDVQPEERTCELTMQDADDAFEFPALKYRGTMLDITENTKKFYYKVWESTEDSNEVDADETEFVVEVTLTGDGETLTAEVTNVYIDGEAQDAKEVTFTNTMLGSLKVVKELKMLKDSEKADRTFTFDIELVSEDYEVGEEYQLEIGGTTRSVVAVDGGDESGKIVLTESITIPGADEDQSESFQIDRIPVNTSFKVTEHLSSSFGYHVDYKVNDVQILARIASVFSADADCAEGTVKAADANTVATATVINTELQAEEKVSVNKEIVNPDGDKHTFYFKLIETDEAGEVKAGGETRKVAVEVKDGETVSFDAISYRGTDMEDADAVEDENNGRKTRDYYYKVFEIDQADYKSKAVENKTAADTLEVDYDQNYYLVKVVLTATQNQLEADVVEVCDADGDKLLDKDGNSALMPSFRNILLGELTVIKAAYGFEKNDAFRFTLTADYDGTYQAKKGGVDTTVTIENGKLDFKLVNKESITIYGLPHGLKVTVYEHGGDGQWNTYHKINWNRTRSGKTAKTTVETSGTMVKYVNHIPGALPQTGQLKWPVMLLAALGIGLLGFGQVTKTRRKKKNGK